MTATSSTNGRPIPSDPIELRRDIAQTRAQLGETVEALAAKADVKARAQETVEAAKVRALETVQTAKVRVREGVHQVAVNAAHAGRELKEHPADQLRATGYRLRLGATRLARSIRERPAPWIVAAGFVALSLTVIRRRGRR